MRKILIITLTSELANLILLYAVSWLPVFKVAKMAKVALAGE